MAFDPLEQELAHATDGWRATSVGRLYPDTHDGYLRMRAESGILGARGYVAASQEPTAGGHAFVYRRMSPGRPVAAPPRGRRARRPSEVIRAATIVAVLAAMAVGVAVIALDLGSMTPPLSAAESAWCSDRENRDYLGIVADRLYPDDPWLVYEGTSVVFGDGGGITDADAGDRSEPWKRVCRGAYEAYR